MQKISWRGKKHELHCLKKQNGKKKIVWVLVKSFVVSLLDNSCGTNVCLGNEGEGGGEVKVHKNACLYVPTL